MNPHLAALPRGDGRFDVIVVDDLDQLHAADRVCCGAVPALAGAGAAPCRHTPGMKVELHLKPNGDAISAQKGVKNGRFGITPSEADAALKRLQERPARTA